MRYDDNTVLQGRAAALYRTTPRAILIADLQERGIPKGSREFAHELWMAEPDEYREAKRLQALHHGLAFDDYVGHAYATAIEAKDGKTITERLHIDPAIIRADARNGGDKERDAADRAGVPWMLEGPAWDNWRTNWARELQGRAAPPPSYRPRRYDLAHDD